MSQILYKHPIFYLLPLFPLNSQPGTIQSSIFQGVWDIGYKWMFKTEVPMRGKKGNLEMKDGVSVKVEARGKVSKQ